MSKTPVLKSRQVEKVLRKLGFTITRQKGSHAFFRHIDGKDHGRSGSSGQNHRERFDEEYLERY